MKKLLFVALLTIFSSAGAFAQAGHGSFTGTVGLASPCTSETFTVFGPIETVFNAPEADGEGQYTVNLRYRGTGNGSQGNVYRVSGTANANFDAPTADFGTYQTFVTPFRMNFVTKGSAPNFSVDATLTIFVVDGVANGAWITAINGSNCTGA